MDPLEVGLRRMEYQYAGWLMDGSSRSISIGTAADDMSIASQRQPRLEISPSPGSTIRRAGPVVREPATTAQAVYLSRTIGSSLQSRPGRRLKRRRFQHHIGLFGARAKL